MFHSLKLQLYALSTVKLAASFKIFQKFAHIRQGHFNVGFLRERIWPPPKVGSQKFGSLTNNKILEDFLQH